MKSNLKIKFLLLFIYAVSLFFVFTVHASNKKTVCSMTYNSNQELENMKRYLPATQFEFVELLPEYEKSKKSEKSEKPSFCKKNVECDILVVSGHFGGAFFGKNNISHSLEDFERASCREDCAGVFRHPKEVFLFGCNTLAGKEKDNRTPEEYIRVLISDGFSPQQAQLVAAFRYSPVGSTNLARFQKVFKGVNRIGGFNTKGPTGFQIEPKIKEYFSKVGSSYSSQLDNLNGFKPDTFLTQLLKRNGFEQVPGSSSEDENPAICYLEDKKTATLEKLLWVEKKIKQESWLNVLNETGDFFNNLKISNLSPEEKEVINRIKIQKDWVQEIQTVIGKLDSFYSVKRKLMFFLKKLELGDESDLRSLERGEIFKLFKSNADIAHKLRDFCSDTNYYNNLISLEEFLPLLGTEVQTSGLACLNDFKLIFEYNQNNRFYFPALSVSKNAKSNLVIKNIEKKKIESDMLESIKIKLAQGYRPEERFVPYLIQNFILTDEVMPIIQSNLDLALFYMAKNAAFYNTNHIFIAEIFENLMLMDHQSLSLWNWLEKALKLNIQNQFKARILNSLITLQIPAPDFVNKYCASSGQSILSLKNETENALEIACLKILSTNDSFRQSNKNLVIVKINSVDKVDSIVFNQLIPYFFSPEEFKKILLGQGDLFLNKMQRYILLNDILDESVSIGTSLSLDEVSTLINEFGPYLSSQALRSFNKVFLAPIILKEKWTSLFTQAQSKAAKSVVLKLFSTQETRSRMFLKLANDSKQVGEFGFSSGELVNERMLIISKFLMNKSDVKVNFLKALEAQPEKNSQIYKMIKGSFAN